MTSCVMTFLYFHLGFSYHPVACSQFLFPVEEGQAS